MSGTAGADHETAFPHTVGKFRDGSHDRRRDGPSLHCGIDQAHPIELVGTVRNSDSSSPHALSSGGRRQGRVRGLWNL